MTLAHDKLTAAARTLENLGYTGEGGELWKPPLGENQQSATVGAPSEEQIAFAVELAGLPRSITMEGGAVYNLLPGIIRAVRHLCATPPAVQAPAPLTDEWLSRHALPAANCPGGSMVVLLSSIKRHLGIGAAAQGGEHV